MWEVIALIYWHINIRWIFICLNFLATGSYDKNKMLNQENIRQTRRELNAFQLAVLYYTVLNIEKLKNCFIQCKYRNENIIVGAPNKIWLLITFKH